MKIYGELYIEIGNYRLVFDVDSGRYASICLLRNLDEPDEDEEELFNLALDCRPRSDIYRFKSECDGPWFRLLARLAGGRAYGIPPRPGEVGMTIFEFPSKAAAEHFAWVLKRQT